MKKAVFFLFFIWILMVPVLADYTVDGVSVTAEVAANGRATVSTVIQLNFDTVTEQVAIPLPDTDVSRVSVGSFRFSTESTDDGTNVIIKSRGGFAGVQSFLITYSVPYSGNGGGSYSLGLLSSRWGRVIGGCSFQVTMPRAMEEPPRIISGYYGALSEAEGGLSVTETSVSGAVSDRMAYDSLTFEADLPEAYFTIRRQNLPGVSINYLTLAMVLVLLLMVLYWRLKLRSRRGEISQRILIPEGIPAYQLPMALDGSTCHIPALILEWANLGYLSISTAAKGVPVLTKLMSMGTERSWAEQQLFARIFGRRRRVAATPGRYSAAAARFRSESRKGLYRVIFDRTGGNPSLVQGLSWILMGLGIGVLSYRLLPDDTGFVVLAALVGIVGAGYGIFLHSAISQYAALRKVSLRGVLCWIALAVLLVLSLIAGALPEMSVGALAVLFSGVATASGPRRSQRGVDAMTQTKGHRLFLRQVSWQRLQVFQGRDSRFFQNYLPQAVALGMDRSFAKRFERLMIPQPEWLDLPRDPAHSAIAIRRQLAPILRQLEEAFK